jgi:ferritin-like metal-binding protein YciE
MLTWHTDLEMSLLESGPSRFQSEPRVDFDFRPTEQLQEANFKFSENNKRLHRRTTNGEKEKGMPVTNPKELFVMLLSDVRQSTERSAKIYQEISQAAQDPDVKEALESRAWISEKDLSAIDRCFELIGEKPVKLSGRLQEVFVEDFRKELAEIQNPPARHLFVLAKAIHLIHFRIAEYAALVAAADMTGHYAVGVLLESCLADKLAFVERTRRLIRNFVAAKVAAKVAAA